MTKKFNTYRNTKTNIETPVYVEIAESVFPLMAVADEFQHEQLQAVAMLVNSAMIAQTRFDLSFDFSHQCGSVGATLEATANFRFYDVMDNRVYEPGPERNQATVKWTTVSNHTVTFIVYRDKCIARLGNDTSKVFYPKIREILAAHKVEVTTANEVHAEF